MIFGSPYRNDWLIQVLPPSPLILVHSLLILFMAPNNSCALNIWTSDVEGAYRVPPMFHQWRLHQIIFIQHFFCVDQCAKFGSFGSAKLWYCSFSLVPGIASNFSNMSDIFTYMDDSWGVSPTSKIVCFQNNFIPLNQEKLLHLFS